MAADKLRHVGRLWIKNSNMARFKRSSRWSKPHATESYFMGHGGLRGKTPVYSGVVFGVFWWWVRKPRQPRALLGVLTYIICVLAIPVTGLLTTHYLRIVPATLITLAVYVICGTIGLLGLDKDTSIVYVLLVFALMIAIWGYTGKEPPLCP